MHIVEAFVDRCKSALVGNVFIDLDLAVQVIWTNGLRVIEKCLEVCELTSDETRDLGSSFNTTEGGSSPCPSSNQLESTRRTGVCCRQIEVDERSDSRASGDLLSCSGHTDDGRNSPPLMTSLEGSTHNVDLSRPASASEKRPEKYRSHISCGIKGEVQSPVSDLDEVILDALASRELTRVHEVRRAELSCPSFLLGIRINCDDTRGSHEGRSVDNAEANAATAEDSNGRVLYPLLLDNSTPGSGNAAPKEANLLQWGRGVYSDDGDIGNNRVLRER